MIATQPKITEHHTKQFRERGFFVLDAYLPEEHVALMRDELQHYMDQIHAEMDREGKDVIGINHRNKRYFIMNRHQETGRLRAVLFSDYMADICRATIGDNAWLLNEQYVIKCPGPGTKFSWHQDSGYVALPHRPWITCWLALDGMSEANGTIYVLPFSRAGTRKRIEHVKDPQTNDMVGYTGPDPGDPVICPAGSIAVFSSVVFHRSGTNSTQHNRRAFTAEYSREPLVDPVNPSQKWAMNRPFLSAGQIVGKVAP